MNACNSIFCKLKVRCRNQPMDEGQTIRTLEKRHQGRRFIDTLFSGQPMLQRCARHTVFFRKLSLAAAILYVLESLHQSANVITFPGILFSCYPGFLTICWIQGSILFSFWKLVNWFLHNLQSQIEPFLSSILFLWFYFLWWLRRWP